LLQLFNRFQQALSLFDRCPALAILLAHRRKARAVSLWANGSLTDLQLLQRFGFPAEPWVLELLARFPHGTSPRAFRSLIPAQSSASSREGWRRFAAMGDRMEPALLPLMRRGFGGLFLQAVLRTLGPDFPCHELLAACDELHNLQAQWTELRTWICRLNSVRSLSTNTQNSGQSPVPTDGPQQSRRELERAVNAQALLFPVLHLPTIGEIREWAAPSPQPIAEIGLMESPAQLERAVEEWRAFHQRIWRACEERDLVEVLELSRIFTLGEKVTVCPVTGFEWLRNEGVYESEGVRYSTLCVERFDPRLEPIVRQREFEAELLARGIEFEEYDWSNNVEEEFWEPPETARFFRWLGDERCTVALRRGLDGSFTGGEIEIRPVGGGVAAPETRLAVTRALGILGRQSNWNNGSQWN
jgi:hypothetical protein